MRFADDLDRHKILDEFIFRPDRTIDWSYLPFSALPVIPIDLPWGKCCPEDSDFIFDQSFIKLRGNEDSHKILDEFDFGPDWTIHLELLALGR